MKCKIEQSHIHGVCTIIVIEAQGGGFAIFRSKSAEIFVALEMHIVTSGLIKRAALPEYDS